MVALAWISWESRCNALMRHSRFDPQLGKAAAKSNAEKWTLNQRVPGSSPGAPTNQIKHLEASCWPRFSREIVVGKGMGSPVELSRTLAAAAPL